MRVFIVLLLLCNAVIFFAALISSAPPPEVNVAVIGAPEVPLATSPWLARISAVLVDGRGAAPVEGSARDAKGTDSRLVNGIVKIPFTEAGAQPFRLNIGVNYEAHVFVECSFNVTSAPATAAPLVKPRETVPPTIIGARAPSLRWLDANELTVELTVPAAARMAIDLVVDGVPRDSKVIDAVGTMRIDFDPYPGRTEGQLVVVHAAGVWPLDRGPWLASRVGQGAVDLGTDEPAILRPAPLASCKQMPAPSASDGLRFAFEAISALALALFAAALFRGVRKDNARGMALAALMVLVVAGAFVGLDVVLRMGFGFVH